VAEGGCRKSSEYSLAQVADLFLDDFQSVMQESHVAATNR
jgi:hypothetical protein